MPASDNSSPLTPFTYLRNLAVFSVLLLIAGALLFSTFLRPWYHPDYLPVFFYILGVNMLSHLFIIRSWKRDPARFVTWFMAASSFKIFMYLIFLVVYFFLRREIVVQLAIVFLILYVFFAGYEVGMLLKNFKKSSEN
jgi:hypothetical protein